MEEVTVNIYSHKQEIVEKMLKEELAIMRDENDALKAELATARKSLQKKTKKPRQGVLKNDLNTQKQSFKTCWIILMNTLGKER